MRSSPLSALRATRPEGESVFGAACHSPRSGKHFRRCVPLSPKGEAFYAVREGFLSREEEILIYYYGELWKRKLPKRKKAGLKKPLYICVPKDDL